MEPYTSVAITNTPPFIQHIIHKHVHDVRNSINSLDLQAVLLEDQVSDLKVAATLKGMRVELTELEAVMNALQLKFAEPQLSTLMASDLTQLKEQQTAPVEKNGEAEVQGIQLRPVTPQRAAVHPPCTTTAEKVMIIDDQAQNLHLISTVLSMLGYAVITASSGEEAFELLTQSTPDLILLDMQMPGMDGIEVCRKLKAKLCWVDIPIIFLSAEDDKNLIVQALEWGAADYITKPFNKAELLSRVRTHLALKRAREKLRDLVEDRDELLGLLMHDLGNDLAGLHLNAVLLERQLDTIPALGAPLVANIVRSIEAVTTFVQEFLANQSAERIQLQAKPLDICAILRSSVGRHSIVAQAKQIEFIIKLPNHPILAHADREGLVHVLDNLLSNAVKFSPTHSSVTLTAGVGPLEWTHFSVSDEGPGFTAKDQERLFSRYGRLSARPTAGEHSTGLGLSIVKRLVEAMKGKVVVGSSPGAGACITVTLPAVLMGDEL